MTKNTTRASFSGELKIGDLRIPCAVLDDGRRVLSQRGVIAALGSNRGGVHANRKTSHTNGVSLPPFLSAKNLSPHISNELADAITKPVVYVFRGSIAHGVEAKLLPEICDVWLRARESGDLVANQLHIAAKAEILIRGLAHVGIISLVDEATGYQKVRARKALEQILEKYISAQLLAWAKKFPDDFYRQIFRLKNWDYSKIVGTRRPPVVGKYTNDIVYARLAPYVLDELRKVNPPNDKGNRKHKHHQWLTEDIGHPALHDHLVGVIALMKSAPNWDYFKKNLDRAYPRLNEPTQLELWFDDDSGIA